MQCDLEERRTDLEERNGTSRGGERVLRGSTYLLVSSIFLPPPFINNVDNHKVQCATPPRSHIAAPQSPCAAPGDPSALPIKVSMTKTKKVNPFIFFVILYGL